MTKEKYGYFKGLLITLDQGFNVLFRGLLNWMFKTERFGYVDEALSSVLGKEVREGDCKVCSVLCGVLSFVLRGPKHCKISIEDDEGYY